MPSFYLVLPVFFCMLYNLCMHILEKLAAAVKVHAHSKLKRGKFVNVREYTRESKEDALGIPDRTVIKPIPRKPGIWEFGIHEHDANRAGKHFDLRLGEGLNAHSWAIRELPEPGRVALAVQQPTHTTKYMDWSGVIDSGYGAGTVKLHDRGKTQVVEAGPDKLVFNRHKGKKTDEYALVRTQDKNWILVNRTTTHGKYQFPKEKASYKEVPFTDKLADSAEHMQPKIDGAHTLVVLHEGKRPRVFSYRESKRGDVLEHTHRIPGFFENRVPKGVGKVVLRAETYLADKEGRPIPERTAPVMNSGIDKALEMQKGTGGLHVMPFDVVGMEGEPYADRLAKVRELVTKMPYLKKIPTAEDKASKQRMVDDIRSGRHPLTKEGVVLWGKEPIKAKVVSDTDVYIRGVFAGEGKYTGHSAGGFYYSKTPNGPIAGKVGTGLSDAFRKELWQHRTRAHGKVATVTYEKEMASGALYAPRFKRFHIDKNTEEWPPAP